MFGTSFVILLVEDAHFFPLSCERITLFFVIGISKEIKITCGAFNSCDLFANVPIYAYLGCCFWSFGKCWQREDRGIDVLHGRYPLWCIFDNSKVNQFLYLYHPSSNQTQKLWWSGYKSRELGSWRLSLTLGVGYLVAEGDSPLERLLPLHVLFILQ